MGAPTAQAPMPAIETTLQSWFAGRTQKPPTATPRAAPSTSRVCQPYQCVWVTGSSVTGGGALSATLGARAASSLVDGSVSAGDDDDHSKPIRAARASVLLCMGRKPITKVT